MAAYISDSLYNLEKRVQITNEVIPEDLSCLAHSTLTKQDVWKWLIGWTNVTFDLPYISNKKNEDGTINEDAPVKIVNGVMASSYGPEPKETWDAESEKYVKKNPKKLTRMEIDGTLMPEIDLFLHEIYRYLSVIYPDHPDFSYLLTRNEIEDSFSQIAEMINYKMPSNFFRTISEALNPEDPLSEEIKLSLVNLDNIAYRRQLAGSLSGLQMIANDVFMNVSVCGVATHIPFKTGSDKSYLDLSPQDLKINYFDQRIGNSFRLLDWFANSTKDIDDKRHLQVYNMSGYEGFIFEYLGDKTYMETDYNSYFSTIEEFCNSILEVGNHQTLFSDAIKIKSKSVAPDLSSSTIVPKIESSGTVYGVHLQEERFPQNYIKVKSLGTKADIINFIRDNTGVFKFSTGATEDVSANRYDNVYKCYSDVARIKEETLVEVQYNQLVRGTLLTQPSLMWGMYPDSFDYAGNSTNHKAVEKELNSISNMSPGTYLLSDNAVHYIVGYNNGRLKITFNEIKDLDWDDLSAKEWSSRFDLLTGKSCDNSKYAIVIRTLENKKVVLLGSLSVKLKKASYGYRAVEADFVIEAIPFEKSDDLCELVYGDEFLEAKKEQSSLLQALATYQVNTESYKKCYAKVKELESVLNQFYKNREYLSDYQKSFVTLENKIEDIYYDTYQDGYVEYKRPVWTQLQRKTEKETDEELKHRENIKDITRLFFKEDGYISYFEIGSISVIPIVSKEKRCLLDDTNYVPIVSNDVTLGYDTFGEKVYHMPLLKETSFGKIDNYYPSKVDSSLYYEYFNDNLVDAVFKNEKKHKVRIVARGENKDSSSCELFFISDESKEKFKTLSVGDTVAGNGLDTESMIVEMSSDSVVINHRILNEDDFEYTFFCKNDIFGESLDGNMSEYVSRLKESGSFSEESPWDIAFYGGKDSHWPHVSKYAKFSPLANPFLNFSPYNEDGAFFNVLNAYKKDEEYAFPSGVELSKKTFYDVHADSVRLVDGKKMLMTADILDNLSIDVENNSLLKSNISVGVNLVMQTDKSGCFTLREKDYYTDPDSEVRFQTLFWKDNTIPKYAQIGTGNSRKQLLRSINDMRLSKVYGATFFDSNLDSISKIDADLQSKADEEIDSAFKDRSLYADASFEEKESSLENELTGDLEQMVAEVTLGEYNCLNNVKVGNDTQTIVDAIFEKQSFENLSSELDNIRVISEDFYDAKIFVKDLRFSRKRVSLNKVADTELPFKPEVSDIDDEIYELDFDLEMFSRSTDEKEDMLTGTKKMDIDKVYLVEVGWENEKSSVNDLPIEVKDSSLLFPEYQTLTTRWERSGAKYRRVRTLRLKLRRSDISYKTICKTIDKLEYTFTVIDGDESDDNVVEIEIRDSAPTSDNWLETTVSNIVVNNKPVFIGFSAKMMQFGGVVSKEQMMKKSDDEEDLLQMIPSKFSYVQNAPYSRRVFYTNDSWDRIEKGVFTRDESVDPIFNAAGDAGCMIRFINEDIKYQPFGESGTSFTQEQVASILKGATAAFTGTELASLIYEAEAHTVTFQKAVEAIDKAFWDKGVFPVVEVISPSNKENVNFITYEDEQEYPSDDVAVNGSSDTTNLTILAKYYALIPIDKNGVRQILFNEIRQDSYFTSITIFNANSLDYSTEAEIFNSNLFEFYNSDGQSFIVEAYIDSLARCSNYISFPKKSICNDYKVLLTIDPGFTSIGKFLEARLDEDDNIIDCSEEDLAELKRKFEEENMSQSLESFIRGSREEKYECEFKSSQAPFMYDEDKDIFYTVAQIVSGVDTTGRKFFSKNKYKIEIAFTDVKYFKNTKSLICQVACDKSRDEYSAKESKKFKLTQFNNLEFNISDLSTLDKVLECKEVYARHEYNEALEPILYSKNASVAGEVAGIKDSITFVVKENSSSTDKDEEERFASTVDKMTPTSGSLPANGVKIDFARIDRLNKFRKLKFFKNNLVFEANVNLSEPDFVSSSDSAFTNVLSQLAIGDEIKAVVALSGAGESIKKISLAGTQNANSGTAVQCIEFANSTLVCGSERSIIYFKEDIASLESESSIALAKAVLQYESAIDRSMTVTKVWFDESSRAWFAVLTDNTRCVTVKWQSFGGSQFSSENEKIIFAEVSGNASQSSISSLSLDGFASSSLIVVNGEIVNKADINIGSVSGSAEEIPAYRDGTDFYDAKGNLLNAELVTTNDDGSYSYHKFPNAQSTPSFETVPSLSCSDADIQVYGANNTLHVLSTSLKYDSDGALSGFTDNKYWKSAELPEYEDTTAEFLADKGIDAAYSLVSGVAEEVKNSISISQHVNSNKEIVWDITISDITKSTTSEQTKNKAQEFKNNFKVLSYTEFLEEKVSTNDTKYRVGRNKSFLPFYINGTSVVYNTESYYQLNRKFARPNDTTSRELTETEYLDYLYAVYAYLFGEKKADSKFDGKPTNALITDSDLILVTSYSSILRISKSFLHSTYDFRNPENWTEIKGPLDLIAQSPSSHAISTYLTVDGLQFKRDHLVPEKLYKITTCYSYNNANFFGGYFFQKDILDNYELSETAIDNISRTYLREDNRYTTPFLAVTQNSVELTVLNIRDLIKKELESSGCLSEYMTQNLRILNIQSMYGKVIATIGSDSSKSSYVIAVSFDEKGKVITSSTNSVGTTLQGPVLTTLTRVKMAFDKKNTLRYRENASSTSVSGSNVKDFYQNTLNNLSTSGYSGSAAEENADLVGKNGLSALDMSIPEDKSAQQLNDALLNCSNEFHSIDDNSSISYNPHDSFFLLKSPASVEIPENLTVRSVSRNRGFTLSSSLQVAQSADSDIRLLFSVKTAADIAEPEKFLQVSKVSSYISRNGELKVPCVTEVEDYEIADRMFLPSQVAYSTSDFSYSDSYPCEEDDINRIYFETDNDGNFEKFKNIQGNCIKYCDETGSKVLLKSARLFEDRDANSLKSLVDCVRSKYALLDAAKPKYLNGEAVLTDYDGKTTGALAKTIRSLSSSSNFRAVEVRFDNSCSFYDNEFNRYEPEEFDSLLEKCLENGEQFNTKENPFSPTLDESDSRFIVKSDSGKSYIWDKKFDCYPIKESLALTLSAIIDYDCSYEATPTVLPMRVVKSSTGQYVIKSSILVTGIDFNGYGLLTNRSSAFDEDYLPYDKSAFLKDANAKLVNENGSPVYIMRNGEPVYTMENDEKVFVQAPVPRYRSFERLIQVEGQIAESEKAIKVNKTIFSSIDNENNEIVLEDYRPFANDDNDDSSFVGKAYSLKLLTMSTQALLASEMNSPDNFHELTTQELESYPPDRVFYSDKSIPLPPFYDESGKLRNTVYAANFSNRNYVNANDRPIYICDKDGYYSELKWDRINDKAIVERLDDGDGDLTQFVNSQNDLRVISPTPLFKSCQSWFKTKFYIENSDKPANPFWEIIEIKPIYNRKLKKFESVATYKMYQKEGSNLVLKTLPENENPFLISRTAYRSVTKGVVSVDKSVPYIMNTVGSTAFSLVLNKKYNKTSNFYGFAYDSNLSESGAWQSHGSDKVNGGVTMSFSCASTEDFSDPNNKDAAKVKITEFALFDENRRLVAYATFPPIEYRTDTQHLCITSIISSKNLSEEDLKRGS